MSLTAIARFLSRKHSYPTHPSLASLSRSLATLVAGCLLAFGAQANPLSETTTLPVAIDEATDIAGETIDEVIVFGSGSIAGERDMKVLADPLRARIVREIRSLNLLDEEFEWRMETAHLELTPPRMRIGYDPRNDSRSTALLPIQTLPLDLMQPATIISIDF